MMREPHARTYGARADVKSPCGLSLDLGCCDRVLWGKAAKPQRLSQWNRTPTSGIQQINCFLRTC